MLKIYACATNVFCISFSGEIVIKLNSSFCYAIAVILDQNSISNNKLSN